MNKKTPTWVPLLYFIASGLFFLAALIWGVKSLGADQGSSLVWLFVWLCFGFVFLSFGLSVRRRQRRGG